MNTRSSEKMMNILTNEQYYNSLASELPTNTGEIEEYFSAAIDAFIKKIDSEYRAHSVMGITTFSPLKDADYPGQTFLRARYILSLMKGIIHIHDLLKRYTVNGDLSTYATYSLPRIYVNTLKNKITFPYGDEAGEPVQDIDVLSRGVSISIQTHKKIYKNVLVVSSSTRNGVTEISILGHERIPTLPYLEETILTGGEFDDRQNIRAVLEFFREISLNNLSDGLRTITTFFSHQKFTVICVDRKIVRIMLYYKNFLDFIKKYFKIFIALYVRIIPMQLSIQIGKQYTNGDYTETNSKIYKILNIDTSHIWIRIRVYFTVYNNRME